MKTYTEEDEKYFEDMQLHGGVLSWDDRQLLHEYLEHKNAEKMKEICNHNCSCKSGEECDGEKIERMVDIYESDRSFKEDYDHENGQYINICRHCDNKFMGHKRRVICKTCQDIYK